jgi:hypothetical protein
VEFTLYKKMVNTYGSDSNMRIANQEKMRFGDGHKFHANISNNRVCTIKRIRI